MKKRIAIILTTAAVLGSSLTAFAAPERMPDGGVFDAEYYAQNNPDVAAALGTDKDALYNHYLVCGRNEQRQPYEPGTEQSVPAFVPVENKTSGTTAAEVVIYMGQPDIEQFPLIYMLTGSRPVRQRWQIPGSRTLSMMRRGFLIAYLVMMQKADYIKLVGIGTSSLTKTESL